MFCYAPVEDEPIHLLCYDEPVQQVVEFVRSQQYFLC